MERGISKKKPKKRTNNILKYLKGTIQDDCTVKQTN